MTGKKIFKFKGLIFIEHVDSEQFINEIGLDKDKSKLNVLKELIDTGRFEEKGFTYVMHKEYVLNEFVEEFPEAGEIQPEWMNLNTLGDSLGE